jgi:CMP-N,N'-diacetyllegionaminic acid synthase
MFRINNRGILEPLNSNREIPYQRQMVEKAYVLNGAIYVGKKELLIEKQSFLTPETIPYIMPNIRSIDIDDMDDFLYCEYVLENKLI